MTLFPVTWKHAILASLAFHLCLLFVGSRLSFLKPTPFPRTIAIQLVASNNTVEQPHASDQASERTIQPSQPLSGKSPTKISHQSDPMIQVPIATALPQKSSINIKEPVPLMETVDTIGIGNIPDVPIEETSAGYEKGSRESSEGGETGSLGISAGVHGKSSFPFVPLTRITRMPILKKRVEPIYPEEARRLGKEGVVLLEVGISDAGKVIHVEVVQPMGYGFDEAAKAAIAQSEFEPAQKESVPVAVIVRMPIRFRFKD